MARKTFKRRRTRKRATKKGYRRKKTYRRKYKTSTGKLWKYVKKATKSEVKRCDALYPDNVTYTNAFPSGDNSELFKPESRFLYRLKMTNNGVTVSYSFGSSMPWNYDGKWRFWYPFQLTFDISKGTQINQRVGDKIFAKYLNFKIQFSSNNLDTRPHFCSLFFVSVKRSVSASYKSENLMDAIWDGIANFCRDGHVTEIYSSANNDNQTAIHQTLMSQSYCQKRKKYLKGISIKKLHSYHTNTILQEFPSYRGTNTNERWYISASGTQTDTTWAASNSSCLTRDGTSHMPTYAATAGPFLSQEKLTTQYVNKLVTLNKEWKYGKHTNDEQNASQSLEEYKYYLIALSSDFHKNTSTSEGDVPGTPDCTYFVSAELVYTDK